MTTTNQDRTFLTRFGRLLFVPPLIAGVLIAVLLVRNRARPQVEAAQEARRVLRTIEVPVVDVAPRVVGYGTAAAGQTWRAVPQVSGRIVEVHPELHSGSIVSKSQTLLKIDRTEFEYAVAQLDAEIKQATALVEELTRTEENYLASLKIEQETLAVAQRELERLKGLAERTTTTRGEVDVQERAVLGQQQRVQEQTNLLNLLPARKQQQEANLALKQAQLAQANLDLEHTEMKAPFDCRLGEVALETDQFVAAGEKLFDAYSIETAEIEAQVAPNDVRRLLQPTDAPAFVAGVSMQRMREIFDVKATVEMAAGGVPGLWPAQFMRVRESLDLQTKSLGLVVGVEKPYENAIPGRRPPLMMGAYCRVTLTGLTRNKQAIVPRSAVRDGQVYVLDKENRLRRQAVRLDFVQGEFAVVAEGLSGGETLIVSDPTPAIEGMLVEPVEDKEVLKRLVADARGESS